MNRLKYLHIIVHGDLCDQALRPLTLFLHSLVSSSRAERLSNHPALLVLVLFSTPPYGLEMSMVSLYERVAEAEAAMAFRAWRNPSTPCGVPPVISVSSGWNDWQVIEP